MKRREFITLVGGAAAMLPVAARAQQPRPWVIGYLGASTAAAERPRTDAFVQRLSELGWIGGHSVAIEYRWAEGRTEPLSEVAAGLVRLRVDIILATSTAAALACKQATAVIPIVFPISGDPLATGLVASLARPGGNVTGLSNEASDSAGAWEFCRRPFPACADWRSWPMPNIPLAHRRSRIFRRRPARSASMSWYSKSGELRKLRPYSTPRASSRPGRFTSSATLS